MEALYKIIAQRSIELEYEDLHSVGRGLLGLYVLDSNIGHLIVLDRSLLSLPRLHRCVLAEEIGHSFYPPRTGIVRFHQERFSGNETIVIAQDERKAFRWATDFLVPDSEVWRAVREGCESVAALADHFFVEEWFVAAKLQFLTEKGAGWLATLGSPWSFGNCPFSVVGESLGKRDSKVSPCSEEDGILDAVSRSRKPWFSCFGKKTPQRRSTIHRV